MSAITLFSAPVNSNSKQNFSVAQPSRVPGAVLSPGTYSISVLDYLDDRSVLQVKDASGKVYSTFIGIQRSSTPRGMHSGLNTWTSSPFPESTFRSWVVPDSEGMLEFAYPKDDAVAVAKTNGQQVPAIDPESEGKSPVGSLSSDDMQVVKLWLLSSSP